MDLNIIIILILVAIPCLAAWAIRISIRRFFRHAWTKTSFRCAIDSFCILLVLLSLETIFVQRKEEAVDQRLMAQLTTESEMAGTWCITGLFKVEHFVNLLPLMVLLPSIAVGLGVHSAQKIRKTKPRLCSPPNALDITVVETAGLKAADKEVVVVVVESKQTIKGVGTAGKPDS